VLVVAAYLWAVARSRGSRWPRHRTVCWVTGVAVAVLAVAGPVAEAAHSDFAAHAISHLMLAMLAPLLLVRAAPVTLLLRVLPIHAGQRVCHALAGRPLTWLTEPVVAAALAVGAVWALYTTGLYTQRRHHPAIHVVVHAHMIISGYLFSTALVGVDPLPHRRRHVHRAAVLVASLAAHDILAKQIYAHPPTGVPAEQGETGAMIMYYGGDVIDVVIMVLLCLQWYRAVQRPSVRSAADRSLLVTR